MATRSDIRDYAREQTLIETDDWGDDKLNRILNRGLHVLSTRFKWPFLATSATITTVADQQEYALPSDVSRVEAIVEAGTRVRLQEVAPGLAWSQYGGDFTSSTSATHFFIWGSNVHLVPTPSAAETNAYTIYYYKTPDTLDNDIDVPEFDDEFHYVLGDYLVARIWEREEDFQRAEVAETQFNNGVEEMARFYLNRASDEPVVVGGGKTSRTRHDITVHMPWLNGA